MTKTRFLALTALFALSVLATAVEPLQIKTSRGRPMRIDQTKQQTPPKWLVGTFWGRTTNDSARLTLTVRANGTAVAHFVPDDGPSTRYQGKYQSGKILFGGSPWQVSNAGKETIRITQITNRRLSAVLSQNIGMGDNAGSRPPKWLIGSYSGKRWDGADAYLTVYSDGRALIGFKQDNGSEWTKINGNYKAMKLNLGNASYKVSSQSWGVRLWQVGTENKIDFHRNAK